MGDRRALVGLLVVSLRPSSARRVTTTCRRGRELFVAPSHVSDLDIRPESLPADIGAAARALWDRNERRAALALLYRGLLSRLVHVHRLPIRDSSTEGDCRLRLPKHIFRARAASYTSRLVRVWQRAVYGREDIQTAAVHDLCDGFSATLDARHPNRRGRNRVVKRKHVALLFVIGLAFLAVWVARNTYWDEVDFPTPPQRGSGEKSLLRHAALCRAAGGAHGVGSRADAFRRPSSVIVLSSWNWNVNQTRRAALERWVESGGRLVIDCGADG